MRVQFSRISGYQPLIAALELPDADDRHVLAAAIRAKAQVIVTFNERDFPEAVLDNYGIYPQHPDIFLRHLIDLEPATVRRRMETMLARWVNPPTTPEVFIDHLERCGLPDSAAALREIFAAS